MTNRRFQLWSDLTRNALPPSRMCAGNAGADIPWHPSRLIIPIHAACPAGKSKIVDYNLVTTLDTDVIVCL